jgi:ComF family protein
MTGFGMQAALAQGRKALVDLLLPPACPACGRADALCTACWARIGFIAPPFCPVYGTSFSCDIGAGALSAAAIADPPPFARARATVVYGEVAKALVHRLKYDRRHEVAEVMAVAMARAGADLLAEAGLIVPVPLHRWRLWRRRFNQASVLGLRLSRRAGVPCDPLALTRVRRTPSQVGLTAGEREQNVRGAFRVAPERRPGVAGQRILLVDDVYTSGATVMAATRTLLRAGAEAVDVLTFARVMR